MIVCVHEDRPAALVGVQLLVASLGEHSPGLPVVVSAPNAPDPFRRWIAERPQVRLIDDPALAREGWNAKPQLLTRLLDEGLPEVVWIDSDVIIRRDIRPLVAGAEPERIICSQAQVWDVHQHAGRGTLRTALWGLPVGRSMPWLISTGFVRVTPVHRPLLRVWRRLLAEPEYRRVQALHQYQRPVHMIGDQDVFTALLGSQPFAHIPLTYLRRGRDMVLSVGPAGHTVGERLTGLFRPPAPMVHCTGPKPWERRNWDSSRQRLAAWYDRITLELGPYARAARRHAGEVDVGSIVGADSMSLGPRLLLGACLGNTSLAGLPLCAFHTACKHAKHLLGRRAWPAPDSNVDESRQPLGEEIVKSELAATGIGA